MYGSQPQLPSASKAHFLVVFGHFPVHSLTPVKGFGKTSQYGQPHGAVPHLYAAATPFE